MNPGPSDTPEEAQHSGQQSTRSTPGPRDRLIVALDLPSRDKALVMVEQLQGTCRWFKIGLELFYSAGADLVRELRRRELNVFLDLKLHDIPNTVAAAVRTLGQLDVQLLSLHASGGAEMLDAAQRAASEYGTTRLLGVTVLTSMNAAQLHQTGVPDGPANQVLRLAGLAQDAGLSGVVCSPIEVASVRSVLGPGATLVVPGVRPLSAALDDQKRVAAPAKAIEAGASMLVIGRPITRAADPANAAAAILEEIESELHDPRKTTAPHASDAEPVPRR